MLIETSSSHAALVATALVRLRSQRRRVRQHGAPPQHSVREKNSSRDGYASPLLGDGGTEIQVDGAAAPGGHHGDPETR